MTDQDYDGSHIKGLILNFIQHWLLPQLIWKTWKQHFFLANGPSKPQSRSRWPSLFKLPGFMTEFVTPIVKTLVQFRFIFVQDRNQAIWDTSWLVDDVKVKVSRRGTMQQFFTMQVGKGQMRISNSVTVEAASLGKHPGIWAMEGPEQQWERVAFEILQRPTKTDCIWHLQAA